MTVEQEFAAKELVQKMRGRLQALRSLAIRAGVTGATKADNELINEIAAVLAKCRQAGL